MSKAKSQFYLRLIYLIGTNFGRNFIWWLAITKPLNLLNFLPVKISSNKIDKGDRVTKNDLETE